MAEMLDSGLAGVYFLMSVELQLPLIKRVIFLMQQAGELVHCRLSLLTSRSPLVWMQSVVAMTRHG